MRVLILAAITAFVIPHASSHSFLSQDALVTEALGIPDALEDNGLSYEFIYTGEVFCNVRGGLNTSGTTEYRGDISLFLKLDTAAAGWWENGLFFVHFQHQHGRGITGEHVADFQVLSNMDADDFTQLSEFWYEHWFLDERLRAKAGKMEANADFAFVDFGGEFINSSPGFSPTISLVTYPDQDWGIVVGAYPLDWISMNVGVYQGRPDGGRSLSNTTDSLYGPLVITESAFHYTVAGLSGDIRFGGWWNGDRFDTIQTNATREDYTESYGAYLTWDQAVWNEPDTSDQGIGIFAQYGWSSPDRSEAHQYFGGGVQWTGALSTRDGDIADLGIFHVDFTNSAGFLDSGETVYELFYKAQIVGWMAVKPNVQYIASPGGAGLDDALALGVRWELVF